MLALFKNGGRCLLVLDSSQKWSHKDSGVWKRRVFFFFKQKGKGETQENHMLFFHTIHLTLVLKLFSVYHKTLKNICHFYFLSVFLPYRNFALMATNLCVFLFFLFFFLHAVPCVGTLNRE